MSEDKHWRWYCLGEKRKTKAEMDVLNRDVMRAIGTTEGEIHDRTGWGRIVSAVATPQPSGPARRRIVSTDVDNHLHDAEVVLELVHLL